MTTGISHTNKKLPTPASDEPTAKRIWSTPAATATSAATTAAALPVLRMRVSSGTKAITTR